MAAITERTHSRPTRTAPVLMPCLAKLYTPAAKNPARANSSSGLTPGPRSQRALGGGDAVHARVELGGVTQRPGERLELGLDDVVGVAAVGHVDVQADRGARHERLEDVPGHRGVV